MVDPFDLSNSLNFDEPDLQTFALFCVAVANKPADITRNKVLKFLEPRGNLLPFDYVWELYQTGRLLPELVKFKLSPYGKMQGAFVGLCQLDRAMNLVNADVDDLMMIKGIGPKTSRYFVLYTKPGARVACLDTHVLKYMRDELKVPAPKSTPSEPLYSQLEQIWLKWCDDAGLSYMDADTMVWLKYARPS